ncbi:MAG: tRNA (adenosine(37)-N6)-threonylcarbamoyltransferase complex dimerization subunit type 1 TsaB [Sphingomonadales bacterium]
MLLVIDTATAACSIALIDGDAVIDERHELVGRGHAERLLPAIDALVGSHRPAGLLVDCGPGSFTGVRIGLAAAQGLAIGWNVPLAGYSSLALLAAGVPDDEVAAALQAGHGQLFVQSYGRDPLAPLDPLRSLPPAEAARCISAHIVVGSGAEALVAARGYGIALDALPRAADVRHLPEPLRSLPPRPIYGRAPDARPMASPESAH